MPQFLDHLLVLCFAVAMPLYGSLTYESFKREVASGDAGARAREYRLVLGLQGLLTAAALFLWSYYGRAWSDLGVTLEAGVGFWIVVALGVALIAFALDQLRRVKRSEPAELAGLRGQLASVEELMPHSRSELRLSLVLAVSAGISEEILWRGFLLFYLSAYLPMWLAAGIAVLGFGLGHIYQGAAGAAKCGVMGAIAVGLYLGSGSLLVPIVLHAVVDIQGVLVGYHVLRRGSRFVEAI